MLHIEALRMFGRNQLSGNFIHGSARLVLAFTSTSSFPLWVALFSMLSSMIASIVAHAAAQPRVFPLYVPPIEPGFNSLNMSALVAIPAKGKPEAMPFAKTMMSGCPSIRCSWPHQRPVLPTPDWTYTSRTLLGPDLFPGLTRLCEWEKAVTSCLSMAMHKAKWLTCRNWDPEHGKMACELYSARFVTLACMTAGVNCILSFQGSCANCFCITNGIWHPGMITSMDL